MKKFLLLLFCSLFFVLPHTNQLLAQTDSTTQIQVDSTGIKNDEIPEPDDEFNSFLLIWAIAFFVCIGIAAFIGAFAALIIIGLLFVMISAGILSTSFLVGFYRKSVTAGFKTFIIILSMITGVVIGTSGLWFIIKIFNLSLALPSSLWIGAAGGCVGGLLTGLIIFKALQLILKYLKNKFSLKA